MSMSITGLVSRMLRPARVVRIARQPAGWFAVGRQLEPVIAWGQLDDSKVVGLVADRHGLCAVVGRRWHGYLPAAPFGASDVQVDPPHVAFPVADLKEGIGDISKIWDAAGHSAIYGRLRAAAELEWAGRALSAFVVDPERFLRRHVELLVEHAHAADLDDDWRTAFAHIHDNAGGPKP